MVTPDVRHEAPEGLLTAALAEGPVLLDGGLSTELEARGHDVSSALWSARLLLDDPAAVVAAHAAFARAGARVLTTVSYQATLPGLLAAGLDRTSAERAITSSVDLARQGLALAGAAGWVAGSVGPYGAHLADGSEYTGAYLSAGQSTGASAGEGRVDERALRAHHRPHLQLLAQAGADVIACETLPGAAEVEALLPELEELGVPAWVSLSAVVDEAGVVRTRRGEPVGPVLAAAAGVGCVLGVGVNCLDPAAVLPALLQAGAAVPAREAVLVAYPNSGEAWDAAARTWSGAGTDADGAGDEGVAAWVAAGARLVGGCCRVRPHHTARTAAVLTSLG
ncbi:homocysteine S-methyltransferase [Quadrisphaera oryzae]|uniref:homocysteine S-methyltransferase n=1 Tax=Quadrisphaera TaxID=317661 RepID=UPI001C93E374